MEAHRPVIGAGVAAGADGGLTAGYDLGAFYDEMFESSGRPRPHYAPLAERLEAMSAAQLEERIRVANAFFLTQGISFTVYGDDEGTDRIFPFDLVPRIVPRTSGTTIERGLVQRLRALNLFLDDIYHRQQILEAGVVPAELVFGCAQLPPRDDRASTYPAGSTPTSAASTSSATATAATWCWRTISALPRASATCSRTGRR